MEEEWWDSGESGKTPPDEHKSEVIGNSEKVTNTLSEEVNLDSRESGNTPLDGPKSVVIGKSEKVTNTLSGEVNLSSGNQYTVWDNNENEKKFVFPSWAWFLVGLIIVPVVLSFTTGLLNNSGNYQEYYADLHSSNNDDVTINEDLFDVYRFDLGRGFEDAFLSNDYWSINAEFENNNPDGYYYWNCNVGVDYQEAAVEEVDDSEGKVWMKCVLVNNWNEDFQDEKVYLRVNGNSIYVATQNDNVPSYVGYWYEYDESPFVFVSCMLWPIVIIGGSIFGFVTQRRALAYGLMTFTGLIFGAFLLFFMLLMMYGF